MLHYLNMLVPVWSKSSKTWNQTLAVIWYLVYVQLRWSRLLVKLSRHPCINKWETNWCIWSGSVVLCEVEGLLEFCPVKQDRAGELCCRVIRASGCSDNRLAVYLSGIKKHCFTSRDSEKNAVRTGALLASECAWDCSLLRTPIPKPDLEFLPCLFFFFQTPDLQSHEFVAFLPRDGAAQDKQNSHFNEQRHDVTHSDTNQTPAAAVPSTPVPTCTILLSPPAGEMFSLVLGDATSRKRGNVHLRLTWPNVTVLLFHLSSKFHSSLCLPRPCWIFWSLRKSKESCLFWNDP